MNNYDFGGWLTEDLKEYREDLLKERNRSELYSDRAELNKLILKISDEITLREKK